MEIKLTTAEAMVLHDLLYRISGKKEYFEDIAEQYVLWSIECQLEKELAELHTDNHSEVVEQARATVKQNGTYYAMICEIDVTEQKVVFQMTEEEFWHTVIGFLEENDWPFGGGLEMKKISGCVSVTPPDMTVEEFEKTFLGFVECNGWSFEGSIAIYGQVGIATVMAKQHLFGSIVEIGEVSTRRWYADAEEWGCDCCG